MDIPQLLQYMAKMYHFEQVDSGDWSEWENIPQVDDPKEAKDEIKGEGLELVDTCDPGDAITALFVDGELKLITYMSTRGSLYQAGAYDGEKEYGASNLGNMGPNAHHPERDEKWVELEGYSCAEIAKSIWEVIPHG